jgi:hypothetical protein
VTVFRSVLESIEVTTPSSVERITSPKLHTPGLIRSHGGSIGQG